MKDDRKPLPIENCHSWWKILCPKTWSQLERTARLDMRHCPVCNEDVYLCDSPEAASEHKEAGHCVCVAAGDEEPKERVSLSP